MLYSSKSLTFFSYDGDLPPVRCRNAHQYDRQDIKFTSCSNNLNEAKCEVISLLSFVSSKFLIYFILLRFLASSFSQGSRFVTSSLGSANMQSMRSRLPWHIVFILQICLQMCPLFIVKQSYDMIRGSLKRRADIPKPLPKKRRRLSISPCQTSNRDSMLLGRLPAELRVEIYKYVLGGELFHLYPIPKRMTHDFCPSIAWNDGYCENCLKVEPVALQAMLITDRVPNNDIALLKVCRQVYIEASDFLYAKNVFEFGDLISFIYFSQTIRPRRLAAITRLQICWEIPCTSKDLRTWKRGWHIIATEMSALTDLRLMLNFSYRAKSISACIEHIQEVRGLKSFNLEFKPSVIEAMTAHGTDLVQVTEFLQRFIQRSVCSKK